MKRSVIVAVAVVVGLASNAAAQQQQGADAAAAKKIASALSAAPAEIGAGAAVVEMGAGGKMVTLRAGANGWQCMAADPGAPGPNPMCVDKVWQTWMGAYMAKQPPQITQIGISYMLAGGADRSNTDPYASKPAPGEQWVVTPAHTMVLLPDPKMLDSYPSDPKTGGPFVMYKGTPYAHLMVPVPKSK
jgi:hypothetical protein